jgi:hypothetical protein
VDDEVNYGEYARRTAAAQRAAYDMALRARDAQRGVDEITGKWMSIPVSEFEALHARIRDLEAQVGQEVTLVIQGFAPAQVRLVRQADGAWSNPEAISLRATASFEIGEADLAAQVHAHDPQSCAQCSGHPLDR